MKDGIRISVARFVATIVVGCGLIALGVLLKGGRSDSRSAPDDRLAKAFARVAKRNSDLAEKARPHVLLISLDALRADHLGCYGYPRDTSPFLDRLAQHGVRFERVISQSPKTGPSHMTLFTGLYPGEHRTHLEYRKEGLPTLVSLDEGIGTLGEWFKATGYRTAARTGGGQVTKELGFGRGFDSYTENFSRMDGTSLLNVREWFAADPYMPSFMFLHTYHVHDPYISPEPFSRMFDPDYSGWIVSDRDKLTEIANGTQFDNMHKAFWKKKGWRVDTSLFTPRDIHHLEALYDGCIRQADSLLETFITDMAENGLLDNTLLIITSDHGEEFMEHGYLMHEKLYVETTHVPLLMVFPGRLSGGDVVEEQVGLIDLTPTILEIAGIEVPDQVRGRSLVSLAEGDGGDDRAVYSEAPWIHRTHHASLRTEQYTLYDYGNGRTELYDWQADPKERMNIAGEEENRKTMSELSNLLLERKVVPGSRDSGTAPDAELMRKLKSLGYAK